MTSIWNWCRGHAEWFFALACAGLGGHAFANDDVSGGWTCLGVGLALLVVFHVLDRAKKHEARIAIEPRRSAGVLPPPPPPDAVKVVVSKEVEPHRLGARPESCSYCTTWKERNPE